MSARFDRVALRLLDRADHLIESSYGYDQSGTMIVYVLPWCYLLALGFLIPALIFGCAWWLIWSAFAANAAIFTLGAVLYWFDDRRQLRKKRAAAVVGTPTEKP